MRKYTWLTGRNGASKLGFQNRSFPLKVLLAAVVLMVAGSSAHATISYYWMALNAASENPVNSSTGTGVGTAIYDDSAHTLTLHIDFSGLSGTTTASHFHAVTATSGLGGDAAAAAVANVSVATTSPSLVGFPLGVTSGTYDGILDLTVAGSWNAPFVTAQGSIAGAEAAFVAALAAGKTYWNVHSTFRTGGEIRGFPILVPEPASLTLLAGAGALMLRRRRA